MVIYPKEFTKRPAPKDTAMQDFLDACVKGDMTDPPDIRYYYTGPIGSYGEGIFHYREAFA